MFEAEFFHQPESGGRFSADSILLAEFADLRGARLAADLGAGCGVVGLSALARSREKPRKFFFVERAPEIWPYLALNLKQYRESAGAELVAVPADWRELTPGRFGGLLDCVLVNPPYFPARSARPSPDPYRDAARRELLGGLAELWAVLSGLVAPGGRAALVLPWSRRPELARLWAAGGFVPRRWEPHPAGAPRLLLAEVVKKL